MVIVQVGSGAPSGRPRHAQLPQVLEKRRQSVADAHSAPPSDVDASVRGAASDDASSPEDDASAVEASPVDDDPEDEEPDDAPVDEAPEDASVPSSPLDPDDDPDALPDDPELPPGEPLEEPQAGRPRARTARKKRQVCFMAGPSRLDPNGRA